MLETYINSTLTILTYLSYLGTVKCKGADTPIVTRFRRTVGQLLRQVRRLDVGHCPSRSITDSDDTVLHVRYCYRLSATLQVIHNYMVQYPPPKKTFYAPHDSFQGQISHSKVHGSLRTGQLNRGVPCQKPHHKLTNTPRSSILENGAI